MGAEDILGDNMEKTLNEEKLEDLILGNLVGDGKIETYVGEIPPYLPKTHDLFMNTNTGKMHIFSSDGKWDEL